MWARAVRAAEGLAPAAKLVAWALSEQFADANGQAWPRKQVIADAIDLSPDSVKRGIKQLEAAGFLVVERAAGRGRASTYQLAMPGDLAAENGGNVAPFPPRKRGQGCAAKGGRAAPAYKNPPRNPPTRTRPHAHAPSARRNRPLITTHVVTFDSSIAEWRDWVGRRGLELDSLGAGVVLNEGRRYALPFEKPPLNSNREDCEMADRWLCSIGIDVGQPEAGR